MKLHRNVVLISPFLIILINYVVAIAAGQMIGKWAFVPVILIEWCLFMFFVLRYGGADSIKQWLKAPERRIGWSILALIIGLTPLPIFLMHYDLLSPWQIWLPWLLLALINPWIEEFYWRGLLLDHSSEWPGWIAVIFSAFLFSANHAVFGLNSTLLAGWEILISTLTMGLIWAAVYMRTKSLRWVIVAHFLVDFLSLSVPSFLDLYKAVR